MKMVIRNVGIIIKLGGVLSLLGSVLFVLFAYALLAYPVEKTCSPKADHCDFLSKAPELLRSLVSPYVIVISLFLIASGVGTFRFGLWYQYKNAIDNA